MRRHTAALAILFVGTALALGTAARAPLGLSYPGSSLDVNRTGDAVQALASGDVRRFFATQPAIGPVSVVVRAPFAAAAGISHDLVALPARYGGTPPLVMPPAFFESQRRLYRFGLFPCLMALVLLAAYASESLARRGIPIQTQLLTGLLVMGLPLWHSAITLGHPDEFVTTGLTLGAVLAAINGRVTSAAVLLGIGLASKQWAVLALPVIALTVPRPDAKKVVAVALGVYLALLLPMAIGNIDRFVDTLGAGSTSANGVVDADTIWLPFAENHDKRVFDGVEFLVLPQRSLPDALSSAIHPLIVLLAIGLSFVFWRRRVHITAEITFLLLALIFLLRCMLDPVTNHYYHAPFLASLAMYEALGRRGLPVLTLIASAAFLPRFGIDADALHEANVLYLAWSIPMAIWLGFKLFARQPLRPKL
jgi:hypothetical protein